MSDRPIRSEQIGDAIARSLDPEADAAKRAIWRRVAGVLVGALDEKTIEVTEDPTAVEAYMPDGSWCFARATAWQVDVVTGFPVALWLKSSDDPLDWDRIWPAVGTSDHKFSIDAEDEAASGYDYAGTKHVAGTGMSITAVTGSHGKALRHTCTVAADDHLVKASDADATAVGSLMGKTTDSPTVTRKLVTENGVEKVQLNTVAQADPISFASTLYAAHLDDPALFGSVTCAFYKVVGGGANFVVSFNPDYTEWEEIRPGVFKSTLSGQGSIRDYIPDGITPVAGMLVASVNPTEYPMNLAYDEIRTGVYVITNPGYTGTVGQPGYSEDYAILERAPGLDASSDFANGCVFQVNQGVGAGKYFRMTNSQPIVLGTTELTWEILDNYTPTASDNLLTSEQLARASDTPNSTALVASLNSPSAWLKFPTLTGTPNLDTYKAGRSEVWALARLHTAGSTGSITWLECLVVRDPGGADITLETINTSPITNPADDIIKAFVDDATDRDLAGDGIGLWIRARSDSSTPAAIAVTWSDSGHSTRLLTPMTLAVGGSDDHQALTPSSRGFTADQGAEARRSRHPRIAIEDIHATVTSISDGNVTPPTGANILVFNDNVTIKRINASQWPADGVAKLKLVFVVGGHLLQGQGDSGSFIGLNFGNFGGYQEDASIDLDNIGIVNLLLIGGKWQLDGQPSYGRKVG